MFIALTTSKKLSYIGCLPLGVIGGNAENFLYRYKFKSLIFMYWQCKIILYYQLIELQESDKSWWVVIIMDSYLTRFDIFCIILLVDSVKLFYIISV